MEIGPYYMPRHGGTFHVILGDVTLTVDSFPEVLMGWYYYCFLYTLNAHNFSSLPPFL